MTVIQVESLEFVAVAQGEFDIALDLLLMEDQLIALDQLVVEA